MNHLTYMGYGVSPQTVCYPGANLSLIARHALSPKEHINIKNYDSRRRSLAKKMNMSEQELEFLLAVVVNDEDHMSLSSMSIKYRRPIDELQLIFESLQGRGYFSDPPCIGQNDVVVVTAEGIMCCLAEMPIENLDRSYFIAFSDAPRAENPAKKMKKSISPLTKYPNEKTFIECLRDEAIDYMGDYGGSAATFTSAINENLENPVNTKYKTALESIGYFALPSEQQATLLLLCHNFLHHGIEPMDLTDERMVTAAKALVTAGLVVIPPRPATDNDSSDSRCRYLVAADVVGVLFHNHTDLIDYSTICRQADIWKSDKIEERTLLFDDEKSRLVDSLRTLVNPEQTAVLMERLHDIGRKSLTCLFYGPPGTGKTELCRQLARSSGRDCIIADPAKLSGSLWGESEKNVRELFRAYRFLYKLSDNAPILVCNEAEGLLSKRFSQVEHSIEKSENAVQGIILQELEDFEGIFIATTNLQNNMDVASDRRFLFKLRFDNPCPQIRSTLIYQKVKGITKEDADTLAEEFELSGGQIDNIASKCIIEQFITGENVSLEKLRTFCHEEISFREDKMSRKPTKGFIRY